MRGGCSHSVPSFPWYIRMGWTVGCRYGGGTVCDVPTLSVPSHGTLGWDGQWDAGMRVVQFGMFPLCALVPWYIRMG